MLRLRRTKTFKAWASVSLAAALVVAPMITAAAAATDLVGEVGTIEDFSPEANKPGYWEDRYAAYGAECYEHGKEHNAHGAVTDGGKTVTLNPFQDSWPGNAWVALIVKGSTKNNVVERPVAGVAYASPQTKHGSQATVSHWIACKGTFPKTQPNLVTPSLQYTEPSCTTPGTLTRSENVDWTSEPNPDASTTWTAAPREGTAFPPGVTVSWTVPDLDQLAEDDCRPAQPPAEEQTVVEDEVDCASETVTITTVITTTPYVWDGDAWVPGEPTDATSTETRALTQDELGDCALIPGDIESVCVGDVPYLGYEVTLPEGFLADSETPVTITFENPGGEDYVVTNQPLSGTLLWPGAHATEPKMWPGWELVDGDYVKTTGNFDWTRNGITVRFDVNPSYSTAVQYPEATALCANPLIGEGTPAATDPLAATGGGVSPMVAVAGGAVLAAGIAAVLIAVYRRRAGMR